MKVDDLSDVIPTAKFLDEFPSGHVPITHTNHLYWRDSNPDDAWEALRDTAEIYDHARAVFGRVDFGYVEMLVGDLRQSFGRNRAEWVPQGERLIRSGCKVSVLIEVMRRWRFDQVFTGFRSYGVATIRAFDTELLGGMPYAQAARKHGVGQQAARAWTVARGMADDYDDAITEGAYWYLVQEQEMADTHPQSLPRAVIVDHIRNAHPHLNIRREAISKRACAVRNGTMSPIERKPEWTKPTS